VTQDFEELQLLGKGDFGQVFMVRSRTDGCAYAVKKGKLAPRTTANKSSAYYEVFAMSSLAGEKTCIHPFMYVHRYKELLLLAYCLNVSLLLTCVRMLIQFCAY
jgi:hypothetical protein